MALSMSVAFAASVMITGSVFAVILAKRAHHARTLARLSQLEPKQFFSPRLRREN